MAHAMPTPKDVLLARRRISPYLAPTPLIRPVALSQELGVDLYRKLENLQPIGAFEVRGGLNLVAAEFEELRGRRLLAASTGNHGQSVAHAAQTFGLPATIGVQAEAPLPSVGQSTPGDPSRPGALATRQAFELPPAMRRHGLAGKRVVCPVSGGNATLPQIGGLFGSGARRTLPGVSALSWPVGLGGPSPGCMRAARCA